MNVTQENEKRNPRFANFGELFAKRKRRVVKPALDVFTTE